jgi:putative ABC transport system substrate-binding protein
MRRRVLLASMAATALLPGSVRAQTSEAPVIGFLGAGSSNGYQSRITTFRRVLREAGFIDGENVRLEYRWANNTLDRLPELAADLVRARVAIIIAAGGAQTALAARAATSSIPIVFQNGSDPVKLGLVASLGRPGGNLTGITVLSSDTVPKRVEIMHALSPSGSGLGWLVYAQGPTRDTNVRDVELASRTLGRQIAIVNVTSGDDFDAAFAALAQARVGALAIGADSLFLSNSDKIINLAARHAIPTVYPFREYVEAGGLVSYGTDFRRTYVEVGFYVSRILKGVKPADLPVQQTTKLELVINMKIAEALGLTIPPSILARADEVIE